MDLKSRLAKPRRHAPRGPLIHRANPMDASDPMEAPRCTATNRQGNRCGRRPIPGGTVCVMHGGAAPQVQEAAMARLMRLQHPAIDRIGQLIGQKEFPTVAYAASRDVLDRTIGKPVEQQSIDATVEISIKWQE